MIVLLRNNNYNYKKKYRISKPLLDVLCDLITALLIAEIIPDWRGTFSNAVLLISSILLMLFLYWFRQWLLSMYKEHIEDSYEIRKKYQEQIRQQQQYFISESNLYNKEKKKNWLLHSKLKKLSYQNKKLNNKYQRLLQDQQACQQDINSIIHASKDLAWHNKK